MTQGSTIVVIGGGGAGLCAAVEAARAGAKVILLEKADKIGGTTAMSVGSLMAAGSRVQKLAGVPDSPQRHLDEMLEMFRQRGVETNLELTRVATHHAGETIDFMEELGVRFIGPLEQPPFRTRRFHNALPGGHAYVEALLRECHRLGVDVRTRTVARRIVRKGQEIQAVETEKGGRSKILAASVVIVATGDFSANAEMRRELLSDPLEGVQVFNPLATGDGHAMAREIGAAIVPRPDLDASALMQVRFAPPQANKRLPWKGAISAGLVKFALEYLPQRLLRPFILREAITALAPERKLFEHGAILVNKSGQRFCDEMRTIGPSILRQPGSIAYILFDWRIRDRFETWPFFVSTAPGIAYAYMSDYRRVRPDLYTEARDSDGMARRLDMDRSVLKTTLEAMRPALDRSNLLALGPVTVWASPTPVGLAVDRRMNVLATDGRPISRLYAAGHAGQGGYTSIHHGHSLLWAFTSGRLAGRHAVEDLGA